MTSAVSNLRRLKYAATINDEALSEVTDPDFELQYVDIGNVDSSGRIDQTATYRFEAAPSRARRIVRHGDVIISTVRTYLQAIAAIENPAENLIVSTGFAVIRPQKGKLDANFCKYAVREPEFINEVIARSVGISYPAINSSELGDISIALPSLAEQRAIAAYLDRETRRLDGLMAAKKRWLTFLAEKRRGLIAQAVTRGLNAAAALRNSNLPWLGQIPKHWTTMRAKYLWRESALPVRDSDEMVTCFRDGQVTLRSNRREEGFTYANGFDLARHFLNLFRSCVRKDPDSWPLDDSSKLRS